MVCQCARARGCVCVCVCVHVCEASQQVAECEIEARGLIRKKARESSRDRELERARDSERVNSRDIENNIRKYSIPISGDHEFTTNNSYIVQ